MILKKIVELFYLDYGGPLHDISDDEGIVGIAKMLAKHGKVNIYFGTSDANI